MLSSACSWNSCQSPMRWPGARASGNSRGYSMKPVGLPMNKPQTIETLHKLVILILGLDFLRHDFLPGGHHFGVRFRCVESFGNRAFFRFELRKRDQQPK